MAGLSCRTDQILVPCTAYPSQRRRPGNAAGAAPSQLMTESARNCAVLAEDAGALTGFTVALCNKLRRMNTEPQRLPLITIVAGVRRARRDLASEQGHASPRDIELSARHVLIDLIRQAPASFRLGEFGRSRWPDVPLDADRPCQTLTGFL